MAMGRRKKQRHAGFWVAKADVSQGPGQGRGLCGVPCCCRDGLYFRATCRLSITYVPPWVKPMTRFSVTF